MRYSGRPESRSHKDLVNQYWRENENTSELDPLRDLFAVLCPDCCIPVNDENKCVNCRQMVDIDEESW